MLKKLFFAAVLAAGPAVAQSECPPQGGIQVPLFEAAKQDFLKGDYRGFHQKITTVIKNTDYDKLFNPLIVGAPNGFSTCSTILQRVETGGMVQEVVLYMLPGGTTLGVYLMGGPVDGQMHVLSFQFSTAIGDVLEKLR